MPLAQLLQLCPMPLLQLFFQLCPALCIGVSPQPHLCMSIIQVPCGCWFHRGTYYFPIFRGIQGL
eukprot:scaffold27255_cov55-Attheya_sp.AAC.1